MRGISSRRNEFGHGTRRRRDQKVWPAAPEYPIARRPDIGTEPALIAPTDRWKNLSFYNGFQSPRRPRFDVCVSSNKDTHSTNHDFSPAP